MRAYYVMEPGPSQKRGSGTFKHAFWTSGDGKFTVCGVPKYDTDRHSHSKTPTCPRCRRAVDEDTQPGNTFSQPLGHYVPPVVERLDPPMLETILSSDNTTRAGRGWQAFLVQAAYCNPSPLFSTKALMAALNSIDHLLVDVSVGTVVGYTPVRGYHDILMQMQPDLNGIWHQVTGWHGNLTWDVYTKTAEVAVIESVTEETIMVSADLTPENLSAIQSLVRQTLTTVASTFAEPVPPEELEAWLVAHVGTPAPVVEPSAVADAPVMVVPIPTLVRQWCAKHDTLPKTPVLVHFSGRTHGNFNQIMRVLRDEGYVFVDQGEYWAVQHPMSPEELRLQELQEQMRKSQEQMRQMQEEISSLMTVVRGKNAPTEK